MSCVHAGMWDTMEDAADDFDAQIESTYEELQRGNPNVERRDAGIQGEQWHDSAISKAIWARGWHEKKVMIDETNKKVPLPPRPSSASCF